MDISVFLAHILMQL